MQEMTFVCPGVLDPSEIRVFLEEVHGAYWPEKDYEFDLEHYPVKLANVAEGYIYRNIDGKITALVLGYVNDKVSARGFISYIARLPNSPISGASVHDAFQLLAKNKGMREIRLEVLASNQRALAFYSRQGYRQIEDRGERLLLTKLI